MEARHPFSVDDVAFSVGLVVLAVSLYVAAGGLWNHVNGTTTPFVDLITQWDSGWYRSIVEGGYHTERVSEGPSAGAANWAFFPLYPLIVRVVVEATGLGINVAGVLVSTACLVVALTFVLDYLERTRDAATADDGAVMLALGPYAFYAASLYTEALFLALIAAGFWCLSTDRYVLAGVVGGLLSATRPTGLAFGVPIAVSLWRRTGAFDPVIDRVVNRDWPAAVRGLSAACVDGRVLALGLVPLGLLAYSAYLWVHVGDPLAFLHVQSAWGRSFGNPFQRLGAAFVNGPLDERYFAAWGVLGLGLSADLIRRGHVGEGCFGLLLILVPMSSGLNSIPRYVYGTGVVAFAAADWLRVRERWETVGVALAGAANVVLLIAWYARMNFVN